VLLLSIDYALYDINRFYSQGYLMKPKRSYLLLSQSLNEPLQTAKGIIREKKSLVLRQINELGQISYGETSPLSGFLEFDLSEALNQAKEWASFLTPSENFSFLGPAISCLNSEIWNLNSEGLFLPETAQIYNDGKSISGCIIKRKIALQSAKEEIPMICEWLQQLDERAQVRLDPNESFSRDDLKQWVDAMEQYRCVQFIEQPTSFRDDDWLIDFSRESPVSIALDEALLRMNTMSLIRELPRNLFLVFKPLFFQDWESLVSLVKDRSDRVVISTAFETPFAYEALIRLAAQSKLSPGLDRSCFLGHPYEFSSHHQPLLQCPSVTVAQLDKLWDSLPK
jgi:o-succinylbenzoate synthase